MRWPEPQDYNEAIQHPRSNLLDAELAEGQPTLNRLGLPQAVSGNFASVYRVKCGSQYWAVKCFTRNTQDQKDRYAGISTYLEHAHLRYTVGFEYQENGIRVQGKPFPILKMEWVDGDSLDKFVKEHRANPHLLKLLAARWIRLVGDLEGVGVAHGDLQHGNVLVVGEDFKLIDYDGMYVPPFKGRFAASNELGDPNYQHPARTNAHFDGRLDRFSTWVIYLSLVAFSEDPRLWTAVRAGEESLLLRSDDLKQPDASDTMRLLLDHGSGETADLAREVIGLLARPPLELPSLAEKHGKPIGSDWLKDHVEVRAPAAQPAAQPAAPKPDEVPPVEERTPAQVGDSSWLESAAYLADTGPAVIPRTAEAAAESEDAVTPVVPGREEPSPPLLGSSWLQTTGGQAVSVMTQPERAAARSDATGSTPGVGAEAAPLVSAPALPKRSARFGARFAPFQLLALLSVLVASVLAFVLPVPAISAPVRWLALLPLAVLVNVAVALHAYLADDALTRGRETRQRLAQEQRALRLLTGEIAATETALTSLVAESAAELGGLAAMRTEYLQKLPPAMEEINRNLAEQLQGIDESLEKVREMAEREISQVDVNLEWLNAQIARIEECEPEQLQKRLLVLQYQSKQDFVLKNDLAQADVPGVPGIICRRLASLGMRTARDLTYNRLEAVPGIGDKYLQALMQWKRVTLNAATAQAPAALSMPEVAAVRAEVADKRSRLEGERVAAMQRRVAEMDGIKAQFAIEMQRLQQERQEDNASANRRLAALLDEHDVNRLDGHCTALQARFTQQQQELDDRLARHRAMQAEKAILIGELEADAIAFSHLTFKRFLVRLYAVR